MSQEFQPNEDQSPRVATLEELRAMLTNSEHIIMASTTMLAVFLGFIYYKEMQISSLTDVGNVNLNQHMAGILGALTAAGFDLRALYRRFQIQADMNNRFPNRNRRR